VHAHWSLGCEVSLSVQIRYRGFSGIGDSFEGIKTLFFLTGLMGVPSGFLGVRGVCFDRMEGSLNGFLVFNRTYGCLKENREQRIFLEIGLFGYLDVPFFPCGLCVVISFFLQSGRALCSLTCLM